MDRRLSWLGVAALALGLVACVDDALSPGHHDNPTAPGGLAPRRALGVVEITISGLGSGRVSSSALSAPSVAELERLRAARQAATVAGAAGTSGSFGPQGFSLPSDWDASGDGTIQLELVSTGSFTAGTRGSDGYRYLYATYRVRNAQSDGAPYDSERQNLTFYAVNTSTTLGESAISALKLFNGQDADESLASAFVPAGAAMQDVRGAVVSRYPDVLQVLSEEEAGDTLDLAGAGVEDVFPYGFVVQNRYGPSSRTLPADPGAGEFDGVVTFAYKVPLQASPSEDSCTVSVVFLAVDDDEVKITQSVEEQTPAGRVAFDQRAAALGADVLTLLPPAGDAVLRGGETVRVLCDVRVAGAPGAGATTVFSSAGTGAWPVPSPLRARHATIPRDARLGAASCDEIAQIGEDRFVVHGSQGGRVKGAYGGAGTRLVRAPAPANGFFPGETVEVTLTSELTGGTPVVAQYRVAAGRAGAIFDHLDPISGEGGYFIPTVADFNGDGLLDIAAPKIVEPEIAILTSVSPGTFALHDTYSLSLVPRQVVAGDVNGDGNVDLVVLLRDLSGDESSPDASQVAVLSNGGDASFTSAGYIVNEFDEDVLALGDIDGDGFVDYAVADLADGPGIVILTNDGTGRFVEAASHPTPMPAYFATGDLDGDGDLDMVVTVADIVGDDDSEYRLIVLLNDGFGRFAAQIDIPTAKDVLGILASDLDGDGDLDILGLAIISQGTLVAYWNR